MTDIPAGATVSVRNALSGKFMCNVYLTRKQCPQSAQHWLCHTISSQINVPWQCVRIVSWEWMEDTADHVYEASFLWVPVDQFYREVEDDSLCFICRSHCVDADTTNSRHMNCSRCFPAFLCEECRIYLPKDTFNEISLEQLAFYNTAEHNLQEKDLWPVCLWCLEESDLPAIASQEPPDRVWHRMGLLSDVFMWKRPDPSRAIWWDVTYHSARNQPLS